MENSVNRNKVVHTHEVVYSLVHWLDDEVFEQYPTWEDCVRTGIFTSPQLETFFGPNTGGGGGYANYARCVQTGVGRYVIAKMLEGTESDEAIKQALSNLPMTERRQVCKISQVRQLCEVLISLVCNHAILIVRLRYRHYPVATSGDDARRSPTDPA